MTTTTHTAQTYTIPPNDQLHFYNSSGQPSPASSTSPQSPHDGIHQYGPNPAKQLRPLKSPLYVPAVLRPTEHFPTIASPMTPPKSTRVSLDNHEDQDESLVQQSDLDAYLAQALNQDGELSKVTGPPSIDHWKPDEASTNCDSPECRTNFNLFVRKHHCRHCGHIFCSYHSSKTIPLDQAAQFHPDGHQVRACEACHRQYQRWDTARSMRRKNSDNSDNDSESVVTTIKTTSPGHLRAGSRDIRGGPRQQPVVANSVPKDWAWSTF